MPLSSFPSASSVIEWSSQEPAKWPMWNVASASHSGLMGSSLISGESVTAAHRSGEAIPCGEFDADLWFAERPEHVDVAKALCGLCPLREQCLAGALERREPWGVWGGQLLLDGAVIAHKRGRGRPRKQPAAA